MNLFQCWTLAALLAIGPALAHAQTPKAAATGSATLETIISGLAYPIGAPMDADVPSAKWAAIAKFPGIKWRDRNVQVQDRMGVYYTRSGSVAIAGLGNTLIIWSGRLPDYAHDAIVWTRVRLLPDQYLGMLKSQLSPAAKVRTVRGGCKEPPYVQSAVFEVAVPGKQPAYLLINTMPNRNDGKTSIQVSPVDESGQWAC